MEETIPKDNKKVIKQAVEILNESGIIAFPTETVYGLGASAYDDEAIKKIYKIKDRPRDNPLIIHVSKLHQAYEIGIFNDIAKKLSENFWPGPLTLLVPLRDKRVSKIARANLTTIGLRIPNHKTTLDILDLFGQAIAAPSANLSGTVSATSAKHVLDDFGNQIDLVIDNGKCKFGIESTIVDVRANQIVILREGAITEDMLINCLNMEIMQYKESKIISPGQLEKHYAPKAEIRMNADTPNFDEFYISFGKDYPNKQSFNLSKCGDLYEAAKNLYSFLRTIDNMGFKKIAISRIPNSGIGVAINDRLERASKK
tara:strand:+ start:454 stop:1395 length:942 start_codon:yes stop_codon:yes gene_type:complete